MSITFPATATRRPLVLVVDDELDITDTYTMLFELHDFTVVVASNGAEALAKLRLAMPDIIVSDCMMPVMTGSRSRRCCPCAERALAAFPFFLIGPSGRMWSWVNAMAMLPFCSGKSRYRQLPQSATIVLPEP